MTFTYTVGTDIAYVRFYSGDTVENDGIMPLGANVSDEEITALVVLHGREGAVAAVLESAAARWAKYVDVDAGPLSERLSQAAQAIQRRLDRWRDDKGLGAGAISYQPLRADGYEDADPSSSNL